LLVRIPSTTGEILNGLVSMISLLL
jgi:hypothetical protein